MIIKIDMQLLIDIMIIIGVVIMVTNIIRYLIFIRGNADVLSSGAKDDRMWEYISLALLVFFLIGYIIVGVVGKPDLVVAGILFGGRIFVAIVITLLFHLVRTVKENSLNMAETLISVVDARDPNLNGHSRHVRNLTMLLYRYLPYSKQAKINPISLEFAALMHDVGKLGIPESIINKPAKLNEEEWAIMKNHASLGAKILSPLNSFKAILPWIKYHHERVDGSGYYHLEKDEIPLASRIIAVADTYSAVTMERSYKASLTYEEAISELKLAAGTQLDPALVDIFCSIPLRKIEACMADVHKQMQRYDEENFR